MKDRALVYLSLLVSLAALGYAAWVHRRAQSLAESALREREKQFVETLTPKVRQMYRGLGITNTVEHPTTLDGLFGPYLDTFNRVVMPSGAEEKNR